jgi:hypothetical protein
MARLLTGGFFGAGPHQDRYSGEIPLDQVCAAFSKGSKAGHLENMENEVMRKNAREEWSGLSESNRHLNLGKVSS